MKRGFTLIELLVVIAAIGILSIIVIKEIGPKMDAAHQQSDNYQSTAIQNDGIPEASGYVVDTTGTITQTTKDIITVSETARAKSNSEVAVLVVPTTGGLSIEEYGIRTGEKWKVGDAEKDNGVIFILATEDRKVRIEVGRGAEAKLSDADAGRIIDNDVMPFLKNHDWNGAALAAYKAITVSMDK